jgi:hypothetical protein
MQLHKHARCFGIKTEFLFDVIQVPTSTSQSRDRDLRLLCQWRRTFLEDWFGLGPRRSQ